MYSLEREGSGRVEGRERREGETGGRREIEMQGRDERVRAGGQRKIRECAREKWSHRQRDRKRNERYRGT